MVAGGGERGGVGGGVIIGSGHAGGDGPGVPHDGDATTGARAFVGFPDSDMPPYQGARSREGQKFRARRTAVPLSTKRLPQCSVESDI